MVFKRKKIASEKTVGGKLRDERKKQKLSIEDVEEGTKVRIKYLEAIERDNWKEFPSRVYVCGFVKRYADFLGLNGDKILEEFKQDFGESSHRNFSRGVMNGRNLNRFIVTPKIIIGSAIFIVVAVIIGYLIFAVNKFSTPPAIEIISPTQETVQQKDIAIEGKTLSTALVTINSQSVNVDDSGNFSQKVELTPGVNFFEIQAKNRIGKESTRLIRVLYNATGVLPIVSATAIQ